MTWLRGQIARQKLPRSIDYTTEMPRDPNGKLYKRRLRDPYWEGHDGRSDKRRVAGAGARFMRCSTSFVTSSIRSEEDAMQ